MVTGADRLRTILHEGDHIALVAGVNDAIGAVLAQRHGFDALWASGLGISTAWGVPDASILTMTEMLQAAAAMAKASTLPVISDCDTGFGEVVNVRRMVTEYESAGIAGVCIEDKEFPKRNSFREHHTLADPYVFAARLAAATDARTDPRFQIIARVEALIAGLELDEALRRARLYAAAGADAVLLHSKATDPGQVLKFAEIWHDTDSPVPLLVIPTTYPQVTAAQLEQAGVAAAIYANQALRASVRAMDGALSLIKSQGSSRQLESSIATVTEIFQLTGTDQVEQWEQTFAAKVEQLRGNTG
jgi:phosphoenolpyruvate phosphomutase